MGLPLNFAVVGVAETPSSAASNAATPPVDVAIQYPPVTESTAIATARPTPSSAVNQGPNGAFAYVIGADGKVAAQPIKVAWTQGATAVIASGVTAGQSVVTDGQLTLKPGAHVKIKAPATAKARS